MPPSIVDTAGLTVVQALAQALAQSGVTHLFGLPGGGSSLDLIDAIEAHGIEFVLTRTENAAVMMAGAMAEASGRPGAALTTKGPGVANAANGVAYACLDRAPVMLITDGFTDQQCAYITHQVFDQRAMLAPVMRDHSRLEGPTAPSDLARLMKRLQTPPYGPVHVELTGGAARARIALEPDAGSADDLPRVTPLPADLDKAMGLLSQARRPAIVVGLEARQYAMQVRRFAARMACPVLPTYKAKGVVDDQDEQVVALFTGGAQEDECLLQADLIVLVGLDPVELILQPWRYQVPVLDISLAGHPVHYLKAQASLIGPIGTSLDALMLAMGRVETGALPNGSMSGWTSQEIGRLRRQALERLAFGPTGYGVAPDRVVQMAADICAAKGLSPRMSVDAGAHMFSATAFFPCRHPGDIAISNGLATMAFALPAAIALSLGDRERPVLCFTGDGGLMMCLGELSTAVQTRARIVVIVFNDSSLSLIDIKQQSRELPAVGVRWDGPDFATVMQGLGGIGLRAQDEAAFEDALSQALNTEGPSLIDVRIDPSGYARQLKAMRG